MLPTVRVISDFTKNVPWLLQRVVAGQWVTTGRYRTRNQAEKALAILLADLQAAANG